MNDSCDIGDDIIRAAALLRAGRLVALATETVYGLGANALDTAAVARVFAAKNRPRFDPLIVHIADDLWLHRLVAEWPDAARRLTERFWPGPLTVVVPKTALVPDLVTSGLPSVAVRMPAHPQALALLKLADIPIAAPSANPFGRLSPTTAEHVAEQLGEQLDYILDGGPCRVGVESTVVQVSGDRITLLRPGGAPLEDLEAVVGKIELVAPIGHDASRTSIARGAPADQPAPSPGMLPQHYAPRTPLVLFDRLDEATAAATTAPPSVGLLALTTPAPEFAVRFAAVETLTSDGDLVTAATNFFAALRRLDNRGLSRIFALRFPNEGLGRALNDRLTRAAQSAVE